MACSAKSVEAQGSRKCLTRRSATAVQLLYLEVSLLLLRLVVLLLAVLPLAAMRRVDWLELWLVLWRLGRVKFRILVSTYLPGVVLFCEFMLTLLADDEKDDDDW
jgi:hypothetical protein